MTATGVIHVLDDDPAVCDALLALFDSEGRAARAHGTPEALLRALEADGANARAVLLDMNLGGRDGVALLPEIRERAPSAPVIVMTGQTEVDLAVRAMKCGAADLLEKPIDGEALLSALDDAPPPAPDAAPSTRWAPLARERIARLTPRERDVFDQLLQGGSHKEMARTLGVSPRTIEVHRARVMEKTGCENLAQLFQLAVAAGCAPVFTCD